MSTDQEQRQAVAHSIEFARKKLNLMDLYPKLSDSDRIEYQKLEELIERGEKLLASKRPLMG